VAGCSGPQSALDPAGFEAEKVAALFNVMLGASAVIWLAVMLLAVVAAYAPPIAARNARPVIWIGGALVPTVVVGVLLVYGLGLMGPLRAAGDGVRIHVSAEQYWWRVSYLAPDDTVILETANRLVLPVDVRSDIYLTSPDVIHSFWVPALAGKVDAIPGRTNRAVLEPTREGRYRGQCAELCGTSHTFMALDVDVVSEEAYRAWLARTAEEARDPVTPEEERGLALFLETGCGACHTIRGTPADGTLGPDLTDMGSRPTIAAGLFPTNTGTIAGWIADAQNLKPGNAMPSFDVLPGEDLRAIAVYLESLE